MEDNKTCVIYDCATVTVMENPPSSLGLVGMILSLVSLILFFFGYLLLGLGSIPSPAFAIAGLILSIVGRVKNKKDSKATAGIIMSSITLSLSAIGVALALLIAAFLIFICLGILLYVLIWFLV